MLIAILSGSFDPFHVGHLELVTRAFEARPLDKVILLPTVRNPNKPPPLPLAQRVAIIKAALKTFSAKHPQLAKKISISLLETKQTPPLYTYKALMTLQKRYARDQLLLLMGEDSYYEVRGYMQRLNLLDTFETLVMPRTEVSSTMIKKFIKQGKSIEHLMPSNTIALAKKYYHKSSLD